MSLPSTKCTSNARQNARHCQVKAQIVVVKVLKVDGLILRQMINKHKTQAEILVCQLRKLHDLKIKLLERQKQLGLETEEGKWYEELIGSQDNLNLVEIKSKTQNKRFSSLQILVSVNKILRDHHTTQPVTDSHKTGAIKNPSQYIEIPIDP